MLSGRVWIDEPCLTDTDIVRGSGFVQKRGLSKGKICIAVAVDAFKNVVAVICGHGKPSSKRTKDALLSHIAPGPVIVHDMERSHPALVKAAKCADEAYEADVADPAYLEAMELVNNLCSWLRRYLFRFPGMKKANLQSYLNWFVVSLPRPPRRGEMDQNCKGASPFAHVRFPLPQLMVTYRPARSETLGIVDIGHLAEECLHSEKIQMYI